MVTFKKNQSISLVIIIGVSIILSISGFRKTSIKNAYFIHSAKEGEPTPWTHDRFDDDEDKFMFALISDLTGGEREHIYNIALQQVNLFRPEFILSVGDLIDGGTEDTDKLDNQWNSFNKRTEAAKSPFFRVGGNHDLSNMVMREYWIDAYGQRYYYFVYKDVLFMVLDSEDYAPELMHEIYIARAEAIKVLDGPNPAKAVETKYFNMQERRTGQIGDEQADYFLEILKKHEEVKWTFLLVHKPVWLNEADTTFAKIENVLSERPSTVISGHFHIYNYDQRNNKDYIMLGTTGGAQNDKNDMAFDHISLVTMTSEGPSIANIRMDGILDKSGHIPLGGDTLCYQASKCGTIASNH
jgi:predicted MPP superfamily phosphohydrolase